MAILADIVERKVKSRAPCRDEHDLKYVDAALEGRADYIVSGDLHLLEMERWEGVRMVTPREFLEIIEKG